jgi:hypothetical protein
MAQSYRRLGRRSPALVIWPPASSVILLIGDLAFEVVIS